MCALPEIVEVVDIIILCAEADGVIVVLRDVCSGADEQREVEHPLGVPSTYGVRHIEHKVHSRCYLRPLVAHCLCAIAVVDAAESATALPGVGDDTEAEPRHDLVSYAELYIG